MGKTTKEIFTEYMESLDNYKGSQDVRWQPFKRPEIFEAEKKFPYKQFIHLTSKEMRDLIKSFRLNKKPVTSANVISNYRSKYGKFFEWCVQNHYTDKNIFTEDILSQKELVKYLCMENEEAVRLFQESEFEDLCTKIRQMGNADYYEALVRSFYEGIASTTELICIKQDMVDFKNRVINFGYKRFNFSEELKRCYRSVSMMENWKAENGRLFKMRDVDGSLFKFTVRSESVRDIQKQIVTARQTITAKKFVDIFEKTGYEVSVKSLYDSGLFNYVKKSCYSDQEFQDLIVGEKNLDYKLGKLNKLALLYGAKYTGAEIRYLFSVYVFLSKNNLGNK